MCTSAWPVSFSKTITGTWEVMANGKLQHVLWYQNRIGPKFPKLSLAELDLFVRLVLVGRPFESFSEAASRFGISEELIVTEANRRLKAAGREAEMKPLPKIVLQPDQSNCLIIPLPGSWESIRLLNTISAGNLLTDIQIALEEPVPSMPEPTWQNAVYGVGSPTVVLKFDIYDILIAQDARAIPSVLPQIVEEKRPKVNDEVFNALGDWYRCPVAVCCFNNAQTYDSKPLALAFEPLHPEKLVVYTLDGHDGQVPNLDVRVPIDHTIFVGSYLSPPRLCAKIKSSDNFTADLRPYLLEHVMGVTLSNVSLENGDFVFSTEHVRKGVFEGRRRLPPHAPLGFPRTGD